MLAIVAVAVERHFVAESDCCAVRTEKTFHHLATALTAIEVRGEHGHAGLHGHHRHASLEREQLAGLLDLSFREDPQQLPLVQGSQCRSCRGSVPSAARNGDYANRLKNPLDAR